MKNGYKRPVRGSLAAVALCVALSAFGGVYDQMSRGSSCEVASPVFRDTPVSIGVVPSVEPVEKMGFFVTGVTRTGGAVRVSWITDVPPPYEVVYGFNTAAPTAGLSRVSVSGGATDILLPAPENAILAHVQVGAAGSLENESARALRDRRRVFSIPALVVGEYYYDVLQRRTSRYKGAYTIYPSDAAQRSESGFRAMLFSPDLKFQYQIGVYPTNGGQTILSRVYEDPNQDSLNYGVGYRMTCTPSSEIVFTRAFSAFPERSDAKIVRIK